MYYTGVYVKMIYIIMVFTYNVLYWCLCKDDIYNNGVYRIVILVFTDDIQL